MEGLAVLYKCDIEKWTNVGQILSRTLTKAPGI